MKQLQGSLLTSAVVLSIAASLHARTAGMARLALVVALMSALISLLPLAQLPSAQQRFDEAMGAIPLTAQPGMRPHPLVIAGFHGTG